jgi:DNA invertase Pin-like site-specific DNA recombinase
MPHSPLVPAAQYLRMSTEHQQYSLLNQSAAIQKYADAQGFQIIRTYSDPARTGVVLRRRKGLQQLLQDAVGGKETYRAILVYDVSRWGRFQDCDEAAHYEFLCKSAGIPVHYCAETFVNDNNPMSLIMKALKRSMAAEYSRELGVKVLDGQRRGASLGLKQGGVAGYGLRRLLVNPDRTPKQPLELGQRKSLMTDRVTLIPGPEHEVQVVREMYRMLVVENRAVHEIAALLNKRGIPYTDGAKWTHYSVETTLTHPKYAGYLVFGQSTARLYTRPRKLPKSQWILTSAAHEAIIDKQTFLAAQQIIQARTIRKTNDEFLQALRNLLAREGKLTRDLIHRASDTPSPSAYIWRFGSLRRAYELIEHCAPVQWEHIELRAHTRAMRETLIFQICVMFPNLISVERHGPRRRSLLRLPHGLIVSVLMVKAVCVWKTTIRWRVTPVPHEREHVLLLARLAPANDSIQDFHVFPRMDRPVTFRIKQQDPWLKNGRRLDSLVQLCEVVAQLGGT